MGSPESYSPEEEEDIGFPESYSPGREEVGTLDLILSTDGGEGVITIFFNLSEKESLLALSSDFFIKVERIAPEALKDGIPFRSLIAM